MIPSKAQSEISFSAFSFCSKMARIAKSWVRTVFLFLFSPLDGSIVSVRPDNLRDRSTGSCCDKKQKGKKKGKEYMRNSIHLPGEI